MEILVGPRQSFAQSSLVLCVIFTTSIMLKSQFTELIKKQNWKRLECEKSCVTLCLVLTPPYPPAPELDCSPKLLTCSLSQAPLSLETLAERTEMAVRRGGFD